MFPLLVGEHCMVRSYSFEPNKHQCPGHRRMDVNQELGSRLTFVSLKGFLAQIRRLQNLLADERSIRQETESSTYALW